MTTCSWAAVAVLALTSICEAREVNTLLGSWSGSASGGTKFALTVADIDPNGRVAGTICSTIADGSVYGLTFSPEDEFYGVKARAKYGVLAVQAWNGLAYTYSPPPPGKATIKQAVRRTGSNAKKRLPLKRATKPTCAEEIVPRMDAVTQPVRRTAEQPLIGEWSGVWNNGPLNEVQIRKIDKRGRVTGVFCENVGTGGLRFWRFEDRQINARARGKERQRIVWIRNAAKYGLAKSTRYTLSLQPGLGTNQLTLVVGNHKRKVRSLTMKRGAHARGCLSRVTQQQVSEPVQKSNRPTRAKGGDGR